MRKILLDEVKNVELNILFYLVDVCEKLKISFFLGYGTLLGAVRHKGFIPWDDDIDILMLRDDYIKFSNYMQGNKNDQYSLLDYDINSHYFAPLSKLQKNDTLIKQHYNQIENFQYGINIDIFILDKLPNNKLLRNLHVILSMAYRYMFGISIRKNKKMTIRELFIRIYCFPFKLLRSEFFIKLIIRHSQKYNHLFKSKFLGVLIYGEGKKDVYKVEEILPPSIVEFEGKSYFAPNNFDKYLRKLYNDYMTLPEISKRVTKHNFDAYVILKGDKDESS